MVVITRVRDVEPDLVQPRRPHEQLPIALVRELPAASDLLEQRRGRGFDARRLLQVDVVAPLHRANRALARVLVVQAAEHVVQQTLAQRAAADVQPRRCCSVLMISARIAMPPAKTGARSAPSPGRSRSSTRRALIISSMMASTAARVTPLSASLSSCATSRAARTVPEEPIARFQPRRRNDRRDRAKLEPHREPRALETFRAQLAVGEMRAADADAADVQAFEMLRLVAFADDELRAAAADVDDEIRRRPWSRCGARRRGRSGAPLRCRR